MKCKYVILCYPMQCNVMQCNVCMYDISIGRLRCLYLDWYMYSICTFFFYISVQNHHPKDQDHVSCPVREMWMCYDCYDVLLCLARFWNVEPCACHRVTPCCPTLLSLLPIVLPWQVENHVKEARSSSTPRRPMIELEYILFS